ncbi:MAG TPA: hypothetical protein VJY35_03495 [Candidatus Eisenbacteria bacterium]|nr:hypothetical protein [Candidatus Eisenbacteria bacterium]
MSRPAFLRSIPFAALLAVALALPPSVAVAADEGTAPDALAPGSWSVQFSVQPDFQLGSYSGSTLSLKKHLASGNALRMGLSVGWSNLSDDLTGSTADTTVFRSQSSVLDANTWSLGINALYLWYAHNAAPVHAYWGLGPSFTITHGHDERTAVLTNSPPGVPASSLTLFDEQKSDGWSTGLGGVLGAEWLVARRVGVFAEYGTSFGYNHVEMKRVSTQTFPSPSAPVTNRDDQTRNRWDFSGSGGRLGVSVYY